MIPLDEAEAENLMHNEPGLLKKAKETTQASPSIVRDDKPKTRRTRVTR